MSERLYLSGDTVTPDFATAFSDSDTTLPPHLIGLSGYAQSGKDTVARLLGEYFGYERLAFADILREAVYRLDTPVRLVQGKDTVRVQELVDGLGWEEAKKQSPEIRRLLQVMGTDVGRWLDPNIWVNKVASIVNSTQPRETAYFAFSDTRFPNEAEWIVANGGVVLRVERPDVYAVNVHESETALDGWDFDGYIQNDGTLEDLAGTVLLAVADVS